MIGTIYLCAYFLARPMYGYDEFGILQLPERAGDPLPFAVGSSILYNFCKFGLLFNCFRQSASPVPHIVGRAVR